MPTEKKKDVNTRTHKFVPLIVVLMLIYIIVVCIVGANISRPQEIAELNKNVETEEEQISAATTTVQAGQSYVIPKDGLYKIELHGGKSTGFGNVSGLNGSKVTGYVRLRAGDILNTQSFEGGSGARINRFTDVYADWGRGGNGMGLSLNGLDIGCVSGAWRS